MKVKPQTVIEVLDAAHLSYCVDDPKFPNRGGIMLVGPPASLKSTMIKMALEEYPDALLISDLNINSLMALRDDLISGRYRTIAFPEYEKLYQRKAETASNIEGSIKALVDEGFYRASFEDQRTVSTYTARTFVVGALTLSFYQKQLNKWLASGFARRFLWCTILPDDMWAVADAIQRWKRIPLDGILHKRPTDRHIDYDLTSKEQDYIRSMVNSQPAPEIPQILLHKVLCVLKWKYGERSSKPLAILEDFKGCLGGGSSVSKLEVAASAGGH